MAGRSHIWTWTAVPIRIIVVRLSPHVPMRSDELFMPHEIEALTLELKVGLWEIWESICKSKDQQRV